MPKLTIRPLGTSGGSPGPGRDPDDGGKPRGEVKGWSVGASRRNTAWLQSVDPLGLGNDGWAATFTMGGFPESSDSFHRARRALLARLDRAGLRRHHWVVESTALGRPHLHMALYGPGQLDRVATLAWLEICDREGWPAEFKAQHVVRITDSIGWAQYLAKHASRGVDHYQRNTIPHGWERTGRLWGHGGDWPIPPPLEVELEQAEFYRYRRLALAYVRAKMRKSGVRGKYIRRTGKALRNPDEKRSRWAGVTHWMHEDVSASLVELSLGAKPHLRTDYEWMD